MDSAIEVYREAYNADFNQGNWEYAEELYRSIIQRFPFSDEKEYALLHLERLKNLRADPHNQMLQSVHRTGATHGFTVLNFVLLLLLIAGAGFLGYFLYQEHQRAEYTELLLEGMINDNVNRPQQAEIKYQIAQKFQPQRALAYRLSAEHYLRRGNTQRAMIEFKQWQTAYPEDPDLTVFSRFLQGSDNRPSEEGS